MKISVTIMAHPKRRVQAIDLRGKLHQYPFVQSCGITWDQKNDEWDTGERALRAGIRAKADWHMVLQDDTILPADFYDHVVAAVSSVPDRSLISLYTGTVRPFSERVAAAVKKAEANNASWIKHYMLLWGVGIIIPTAHIEPMLEFVADFTEVYDIRIGIFYQRNRLPVFYTNPSLVDHNDALDSLIGNDYAKMPRVAHRFIRGNINWNGQSVDM